MVLAIWETSGASNFNGQALDLAYHGDPLLSQDIGRAVRRDVLLFGDRNHICHRFINVGDLLHRALAIEAAGVQAINATDDSAGADDVIA